MPFFSRSTSSKPAPGAPDISCSFCGKARIQVKKLVAGENVYICDECIGTCNDVIAKELGDEETKARAPIATLTGVIEALDRAVVGQRDAKLALGAALVVQTRRLHAPEAALRPARVLVVGPRGCGKTRLASALCAFDPKLPSYHADCSRLTETGYVGENVDNFLSLIIERAEFPSLAHQGLLFLDGLHHLATRAGMKAREVSGAEVQGELVRVLDGLPARVVRGVPRHPDQAGADFPCAKLLVAASWTLDAPPEGDEALRDALFDSGMTRELLSRFDRIVVATRLSVDEMEHVLARELDLVRALTPELRITNDALRVIAEHAAQSSDGAFALRRPLARMQEEALLGSLPPIGVENAKRLSS